MTKYELYVKIDKNLKKLERKATIKLLMERILLCTNLIKQAKM